MRKIEEGIIDSDYVQMTMIQTEIEKKQKNSQKSEPVIICL